RSVDNLVALTFALLVINDGEDAVAVHGDQLAPLVADRIDADELRETVRLRVLGGLFADSSRRSTDVERTHRQLCPGLADGLGRDDADRFAAFDHPAGSKVATVAKLADAAFGFAGEHGTDLHPLNTGSLDGAGQFFRDFLIHLHDNVGFVVELVFQRNAAHNAVAQRLDDFARFDNRFHVNTIGRTAIGLGDDDILGHVAESARQIAGIGRLESRIRQTFASAVGRDE